MVQTKVVEERWVYNLNRFSESARRTMVLVENTLRANPRFRHLSVFPAPVKEITVLARKSTDSFDPMVAANDDVSGIG